MENIVTANELKTKGISRLDEISASGEEHLARIASR